jgi:hypothetical protein
MLTRKNKLVTRKDLDAAQYANIENGDLLSDEHPGAKLKVHKDTGLVDNKYDSFTITNDAAMEVIGHHYSDSESNRINKMTRMVNDCTNILKQQDDVPHSTTTLMATMGYNRNTFYIFIRKLIYHDIVHILIMNVDNRIVKTIILNPHIARRSKIQHGLILAFKDISKGLNKIVIEELPKFPTEVNVAKSLTSK